MPLKYPFILALLVTSPLGFTSETLSRHHNGSLIVEKDHDQNNLRMLRGKSGPMRLRDRSLRPLHEKVANQFAPEFGLRNPDTQLEMKQQRTEKGSTHIRYQQLHQNLPVIGAELIANLNPQNELRSMSGEVSPAQSSTGINTTPTISSQTAANMAINAMSKWHKLDPSQLGANTPVLSIYDPSILVRTRTAHSLVWKIEVSTNYISPLSEFVLIDAHKGGVLLHFNQINSALNRETFTANNQASLAILPGTRVCNESDPTCINGDTDAQNAHATAANVYDFYFNTHGRDSIDGNGMTLTSTTHFGNAANAPRPFKNAFWLGTDPATNTAYNQIAFGDNYASADDVVAHELTHGVTDFTSNLLYYSESGAINESFSDVWGELIDLSNNIGNDAPGVRWLLGEDLPDGAIRDMANPTVSPYFNPDRMSSSLFYIGPANNGGVHTNSAINNKAAYLMVDGSIDEPGGQFNGSTISPIGITKTAKIYYEAQTNLLTTGSDYLDLYNALNQACSNLVGSSGITTTDCAQVLLALNAVEMNQAPINNYAPTATICPASINVYDLFFDDFEVNNLNNWQTNTDAGSTGKWSTDNINISSNNGTYTVSASGYDSITTPGRINVSSLALKTAIRIPSNTTAYVHFDQAFYFDSSGTTNYDGGFIEYSTNNGLTWIDANTLVEMGRSYTGTLTTSSTAYNNKNAFASFSNGYNSTRLNLSSLAGQFIRFRFKSFADESAESGPWSIDNFRIYLCATNAPPVPNAGPDQTVSLAQPVRLAGTATDPDGDSLSYLWTQISGPTVSLSNTTILDPSFAAPFSPSRIEFSLRVTSNGQSESDTVQVNVVAPGKGGCSVSPNAPFDPIWIFLLTMLSAVHLYIRKTTPLKN